uniref:Uncharacterized protein n=1 Tax=Rhizophora mucronata TaxID=61149 RepID=A0A2P2IUG6_RHIMU
MKKRDIHMKVKFECIDNVKVPVHKVQKTNKKLQPMHVIDNSVLIAQQTRR